MRGAGAEVGEAGAGPLPFPGLLPPPLAGSPPSCPCSAKLFSPGSRVHPAAPPPHAHPAPQAPLPGPCLPATACPSVSCRPPPTPAIGAPSSPFPALRLGLLSCETSKGGRAPGGSPTSARPARGWHLALVRLKRGSRGPFQRKAGGHGLGNAGLCEAGGAGRTAGSLRTNAVSAPAATAPGNWTAPAGPQYPENNQWAFNFHTITVLLNLNLMCYCSTICSTP